MPRQSVSFSEDFRRFFVRGLAAILPTLITFWLIVWAWNFLWEYLGQHLVFGIKWLWLTLADRNLLPATMDEPAGYIGRYWRDDLFRTRLVGVVLAILLVYIVGVFLGNFIGRTAWRLAEVALMKVPLVRAIYPAVKQVIDFILSDRRTSQFQSSRVVAVRPHESGIWSIGFVTGRGPTTLSESTGDEMITVFVPSTPTAFSGYVLVVPRKDAVELPMAVEDAMRLLISGGVLTEKDAATLPTGVKEALLGERARRHGEQPALEPTSGAREPRP